MSAPRTATRVAFDVGPLHGARTGVGVAVARLAEVLGARDDVTLVPYLTSFRSRPQPGVRRLPIPAALAVRSWGATGRPRVDCWLDGAQVVHGTNYVVPPSRAPRLVSVYDCWFLDHPGDARPAVVRAGRALRRAIDEGAVVHACSTATASAVSRHAPGVDVRTIPLAAFTLPDAPATCPLDGFPPGRFVLAIGTLERRKNLPTLVRAFARACDLAPGLTDVRLVLAGGDGDDHEAVAAALAQLADSVRARVIRTGWVDEPTRAWLLRHCSVLAYPSLDEGFGFPLFDAMQAGVPIVASDAGSIPEVSGDAALRRRPDDVDGLAEALAAVLTDHDLAQRLVDAGVVQLARFDWAATADALAQLYTHLAGDRP
jgi:glycosyltransferase involved in cell wall biosynthesis